MASRIAKSIVLTQRVVFLAWLAATSLVAQQVSPRTGTLILVGGGASPPAVMARFQELAGGANTKIVVIPSALEDGDEATFTQGLARMHTRATQMFGANAIVLHTRDPKVADSAEFVGPLLHATGVWILGGDEHILVRAYGGTRMEKEINAIYARGGVVGGTSAGAVIAGSVVPDGKADPSTPRGFVLRAILPGFALLPGSVVIPHWSQRKLNFDLLEAVLEKDPGTLGIGIDEDTAAVIEGDRCPC